MYFNNIFKKIGNTPIFKFPYKDSAPEVKFFIKLEGENITGSVKDRAAYSIITDKIKSGELTSGKRILDASSGSFACALAFLGKMFGFPVTVVVGSKITDDKVIYIRAMDGEIIPFGNFTKEGNDKCRKMLEKEPGKYCFIDQLHNPLNALTHERSTAPEIIADLPDVSAIAFSLGSGGTLCGISRYMKKYYPHVKIIAVTAASGTRIPGTGAFVDKDYQTPFINEAFDNKYFDYIAVISEADAKKRTKELIYNYGFWVGIQTGGVLQGMLDAVDALKIKGKVLIISGDSGWKNMEKLLALSI